MNIIKLIMLSALLIFSYVANAQHVQRDCKFWPRYGKSCTENIMITCKIGDLIRSTLQTNCTARKINDKTIQFGTKGTRFICPGQWVDGVTKQPFKYNGHIIRTELMFCSRPN